MTTWTAPRTWAVGEKVTAARLNTNLRDNSLVLGEAWPSYNPEWTADTTNPTIGNGSIVGARRIVGKTCDFRVIITMGSTTTYGSGGYFVSLPDTTVTGVQLVACEVNNSGAVYHCRGRVLSGGTTVQLVAPPTTAGNNDRSVTGTIPTTLGTGDNIIVSGTVQLA